MEVCLIYRLEAAQQFPFKWISFLSFKVYLINGDYFHHLYSWFWKICKISQLLPQEYIWIMCSRKRLLQYLELSWCKTCSHSSWLAFSFVLLVFQNYFCKGLNYNNKNTEEGSEWIAVFGRNDLNVFFTVNLQFVARNVSLCRRSVVCVDIVIKYTQFKVGRY